MNTLIFFGSPRKNGGTAALTDILCRGLAGGHKLVYAYSSDISPCVDCRACRTLPGCVIKDSMSEVYDCIAECDNIVIASPIYYAELTGRLLDVASRLQTFFSARRYRGEKPRIRPKRGGVILVGGGSGGAERAFETAKMIMREMNCRDIFAPVCSTNTDAVPAETDEIALSKIKALTDFLNDTERT
ncbi:MAG: flavodoxin family protein [Oscillospiraceae bacterium]|nr:flavodoxin family protein [Oscillospiraceae bacterium]